jgi:EmrB/QacA subfamily drug resistance transporter
MRPPCDEAVIRSGDVATPCAAKTRTGVLVATIIGSSMAFIDSTVVNVALPALQSAFHATVANVQWVVESYGVILGALILVGGSLGDRLGRRRMFLWGVAVFAVASVCCGFAANIIQLILARSVQGAGAALLVPGSLALISSSFDEKTRGPAIGTWSGFTAMTTAVGPVLGGWLIQYASWRYVFFINLPLAAAVIVLSLAYIPESRSTEAGPIDGYGALAITVGLGGLVCAFIESPVMGWGRPLVLTSLIAGCGCLILFLFVEAHARVPMVPLSLFSSAAFSGTNLLTLFLYGATGIFFFLFPLNLIQIQGYSPTATGAAMLPLILLIFLLSRWSGGLVARYGARPPLVVGPLIVAFGFLLFAAPSTGHSYWTSFFPAVLVLGLGMAITVAPLTTVVMDSVGQDRVGAASGINNAVARVASVLAVAVLGMVMVKAFGVHLNRSLLRLSLPPGAFAALRSGEIMLAGLPVPAGLSPATTAALRKMIVEAFVFGFRTVMWICAALSAASSGVAWWMVPGDERNSRSPQPVVSGAASSTR